MLSLLQINNIALIDDLRVEFRDGLNLLTGETGSGKSIIVDSLGALTGSRVSGDLIKQGEETARIEGVFDLRLSGELRELLEEAGIQIDRTADQELIVRRELSANGRNRVFINDKLVTQGLLKQIGCFLADIHGQGEQTTLFDPASHIGLLDSFANCEDEKSRVAELFGEMSSLQSELSELRNDDARKLQLLDILTFQTDEIEKLGLDQGEDESLEEEKKRLVNVERISSLSEEAYGLVYENDDAIVSQLDRISRLVEELTEFESAFDEYSEGLESAKAVLSELAISVRDFKNSVEFSPSRLEEIENRLAEISAAKRKYGGTLDAVLAHYEDARKRLSNIRTAEAKEEELLETLSEKTEQFRMASTKLSKLRKKASRQFEKKVVEHCASVALEKAAFEVRFEDLPEGLYRSDGIDDVEFYFSANPGEPPRPLAKVASGGEASRLMLILKTAAGIDSEGKAVVFDEVDAGIGGRVAEAVGLKLQGLSGSQQILCVTHHPQVAALADHHFLVEKTDDGKNTKVTLCELNKDARLEEIARMLAGEEITEAARENARALMSGKANTANK
ncbi:MAG: DNA repair protein RecN [Pyrinomonadaceae bacterium]|nr:DNA repair protein RecN [Pyrinomonadaceae bacterium]